MCTAWVSRSSWRIIAACATVPCPPRAALARSIAAPEMAIVPALSGRTVRR